MEKLEHSFVTIHSGQMCAQPSISSCSFQCFRNDLVEKLQHRNDLVEKLPSWPFIAAKCAGNPPSPGAVFNVSGTTWWRNCSTPSWPFIAAKCAGNAPFPAAVFNVAGTTWWRNCSTPSWPFIAAKCAGNPPFPAAVFNVSGTT